MSADLKSEITPFLEAVSEKKAENIVALNLGELTSIADAFIICSGNSNRQVKAIGESVLQKLKQQGLQPLSCEGLSEGRWVLLDYGHVIIHIFYETVRQYYDIEGLWSDAEKIELF